MHRDFEEGARSATDTFSTKQNKKMVLNECKRDPTRPPPQLDMEECGKREGGGSEEMHGR